MRAASSSWVAVMNAEHLPAPEGGEHWGGEQWGGERGDHEQRETEPAERPRIYVASLSDYNAGILHGEWIDADQDIADVQESVERMLGRSPSDPRAEEFAVHDFEGFGAMGVGEYDSLAWITSVARGISEHGPAFAAWADQCEQDVARLGQFEEAYLGEWDSLERYAEELLDDLGVSEIIEQAIPTSLQPYVRVDYQAFAHDLQLGGDVTVVASPAGGIWLFQPDA